MNEVLHEEGSAAVALLAEPEEAAGGPGELPGPEEPGEDLRRQQAIVAMGRRATAPPDLAVFLQDAAALIADLLGVEHSLVAELTGDESAVPLRLYLAGAGAEADPPREDEMLPDREDSLIGYALQHGEPVLVNDLTSESRFDDSYLRRRGIRSALAVPLRLQERPFGALVACSRRPRSFPAQEMLFAEAIAHLVSATIARCHAERALERQRQVNEGLMETVGALVLVLDTHGRVTHANRTCQRVSGFTPAEIRQRPIWEVFPVPEEVTLFHVIFDRLREGISPVECETWLQTREGNRRRIAWSYASVCTPQGAVESILATGIDISDHLPSDATASDRPGATLSAGTGDDALAASSQGSGREEAVVTPFTVVRSDRRRRPRRAYPYHQLLAPMAGGKLPDRRDYAEVLCSDIGSGGFSFLIPHPPTANQYVVGLGTPPRLTYLSAEVVHVTRIKRDSGTLYRIGCCYTGRISYRPV